MREAPYKKPSSSKQEQEERNQKNVQQHQHHFTRMTAKVNGSKTIANEAVIVQALTVGRRRRPLSQLDDHKIARVMITALEEKSEYVSLRKRTISTSSSSDLDEQKAETTAAVGSYNWLGPFSADISTLTGVCRETANRVASFFQFAQNDIVFTGFIAEHDFSRHHPDRLRLPWEVRCAGEETYQEDYELKEKIQGLSFDDENFLKPFNVTELSANDLELQSPGGHKYYNAPGTFCFVLDRPHTQLAYRIMQVDPQLRATRERLLNLPTATATATTSAATKERGSSWSYTSSNSNSACSGRSIIQSGSAQETIFWKNYFYHCNETRISHLALYEDTRDETPMPSASTCIVGNSWLSSATGCPGLTFMTSTTADEEEEENFKLFQPAFPKQIIRYQEVE